MIEEDHLFTLEVDIIQFDQDSDRVVINGSLGDKIEPLYTGKDLMFQGSEASISLELSPEEIQELIKKVTELAPELP
ncbi:hypothetical protein KQH65_01455 [archaeon]|nr:hypothetical protein [archaeon]